MTEYDYSPEAYERYVNTQRSITRWVEKTSRSKELGNPFTPATPSPYTRAELKWEHENDKKRSKHKDRDRDKDEDKDKDRGRNRERTDFYEGRERGKDKKGYGDPHEYTYPYHHKEGSKSSSRPLHSRSKTGPSPPPSKHRPSRRASYDQHEVYEIRSGADSKHKLISLSKHDIVSKYGPRTTSKPLKSIQQYDLPSATTTSTSRPKHVRSAGTAHLPTSQLSLPTTKHSVDYPSGHRLDTSKYPLSAPPADSYVHSLPSRQKPERSQTIPSQFPVVPPSQKINTYHEKVTTASRVQGYPYPYAQPAIIPPQLHQPYQYPGYPYLPPQSFANIMPYQTAPQQQPPRVQHAPVIPQQPQSPSKPQQQPFLKRLLTNLTGSRSSESKAFSLQGRHSFSSRDQPEPQQAPHPPAKKSDKRRRGKSV